jgi:hypothetical protein
MGADAVALDKHTADERACCAVFALLCADLDGLPHVIFRPGHWRVSMNYLIDNI